MFTEQKSFTEKIALSTTFLSYDRVVRWRQKKKEGGTGINYHPANTERSYLPKQYSK